MLTKEQFFKKRCSVTNVTEQRTSMFSHSMVVGKCYQMFICTVTMEPFNPYTKTNKGRDYKCFTSYASSYHCKELAWNYVKEYL